MAVAGNGGQVSFRVDPDAVTNAVGSAELKQHTENRPLIIAAGTTRNNLTGLQNFTDAIIAGTLEVSGPLDLRLTGTLYLAPNGRIVLRQGINGGNLTVHSRGTPILQGLIDARGEDGQSDPTPGGNGGTIDFRQSTSGAMLVPTLITRGGDSNKADVTLPDGGPTGGHGGAINLALADSQLYLGGGVGPRVNGDEVPPLSSRPPFTHMPPPVHTSDFLPPIPSGLGPTSFGVMAVIGVRPLLQKAFAIAGFTRGVLTTGGMGGMGVGGANAQQRGGAGGNGGNITVTAEADGSISMRDMDIITGAEAETFIMRYFLPETGASQQSVCPSSGSAGGVGGVINVSSPRGDGGPGGKAGDISFSGSLAPAPVSFVQKNRIQGFQSGSRLLPYLCGMGEIFLGETIEAAGATGEKLYRIRVNSGGNAVGGLGGIPSGAAPGQTPGKVGAQGATGSIQGLPRQ